MHTFSRFILAATLVPAAAHAELNWIWVSPKSAPNARATFTKTFELPAGAQVKKAQLQVSADNGCRVTINKLIGAQNENWDQPSKANVLDAIRPGKNEVQIDARNIDGVAAVTARIIITLADKTTITWETDGTWQATEPGNTTPKPAHVVAKYGAQPWGDVFAGGKSDTATEADDIQVAPGFKVERLYSVPKTEQGSWVSMTVDPKGRLIACDQRGGLYRATVPEIGKPGETAVEPLKTKVGGAHGLLYAFESLYVMVNEKDGKGLWRLQDKDGDGQFETETFLRKMDGGGEHGTHGMKLSPDGKSIYFVNGNHTKLPENMELSRAPMGSWKEDHVIERMWDANGHARGVMAPGGYICKTDPEGKTIELISHGYRNSYGIAFNELGDVFTYDSDMEWDAGAPWYRPTRICVATSGSDLGWRSGAGKWPTYYPDSLPAVIDIGPGSPTGVASGAGAKFPAKYQRAIYACDWTYGTMYAIHLTPKGGGYTAVAEEFVSGKPLPLTDLVIRPQDGAMYFAIGGRNTQSGLYRVTYTGSESTARSDGEASMSHAAMLRRSLETLHQPGTGPDAIAKANPHLGNPDRFVRWAARVAIERQPVDLWAGAIIRQPSPQALLEGALALARMGNKSHQSDLLGKLNELDFAKLTADQQLALIRIYQLTIIRQGIPEGAQKDTLIARLDALFPAKTNALNDQLAQTLVALGSTKVVAKTVQLMATAKDDVIHFANESLLNRNAGYATAFNKAADSSPNRQQIAYAYALREAKVGWTPELRKTYFAWFPRTAMWQGGNSLKKFIENMRTESLENVTDAAERAALDELSKQKPAALAANIVAPKGPGKNYSIDDVLALTAGGLKGRDYANGKAMFDSTLCSTCHRFAGAGGGLGPDITGSANRYTMRDLLENIIEPSKVVSDQYESTEISLKDGSTVIGRIIVEENGKLFVAQNPFAPADTTAVDESKVASKKPYAVSMMPPGLINSLNKDELLNLLAYILSAGDPNHAAFKK